MTISPAQARSLYAQVLDHQARLVRRGALAGPAHEVAEGYYTVVDTTVLRCSCGEWIDRPNDEAQGAYALHVADRLRLKITLGRAA